jgi:acyl-CoA synthetase (NDP forming)
MFTCYVLLLEKSRLNPVDISANLDNKTRKMFLEFVVEDQFGTRIILLLTQASKFFADDNDYKILCKGREAVWNYIKNFIQR